MPTGALGAARIGFNRQTARALARTRVVTQIIEDRKAPATLAYLGESMANYAKYNAPFSDQTGNLRRSITWVVLAPGQSTEVPYQTETDGVQNVPVVNDTAGPMLVFFAGMKYGVYVEFLDGYWVLSGAYEHFKPLFRELLGPALRFKPAEVLS